MNADEGADVMMEKPTEPVTDPTPMPVELAPGAVRLRDWAYVQSQLRHEAEADERECFFCHCPPPGLLFQPSETGVSEMPFWICPACVVLQADLTAPSF